MFLTNTKIYIYLENLYPRYTFDPLKWEELLECIKKFSINHIENYIAGEKIISIEDINSLNNYLNQHFIYGEYEKLKNIDGFKGIKDSFLIEYKKELFNSIPSEYYEMKEPPALLQDINKINSLSNILFVDRLNSLLNAPYASFRENLFNLTDKEFPNDLKEFVNSFEVNYAYKLLKAVRYLIVMRNTDYFFIETSLLRKNKAVREVISCEEEIIQMKEFSYYPGETFDTVLNEYLGTETTNEKSLFAGLLIFLYQNFK